VEDWVAIFQGKLLAPIEVDAAREVGGGMQVDPQQRDGQLQAPVAAFGVVEVVEFDAFVAGVGLGILGEAGAAYHDPAAGADVLDDCDELPHSVHVGWTAAVPCLHDREMIGADLARPTGRRWPAVDRRSARRRGRSTPRGMSPGLEPLLQVVADYKRLSAVLGAGRPA
jgi:hypothetical protein